MQVVFKRDFNSHAHVERDYTARAYVYNGSISTHTLTWSVTFKPPVNAKFDFISTHTLTWSVTEKKTKKGIRMTISTHTLTWSVTIIGSSGLSGSFNFNSHAHVERDFIGNAEKIKLFISTHTLTWSVTAIKIGITVYNLFQLTRSRGA